MLTTARTYACLAGLLAAAAVSVPLSASNLPGADTRVVPALAGVWKAQELKVPAATDLDRQVWGENASKVRNVQLLLEPDGAGTLRIASSVVDSKGRPKQYSQSVIEARVTLSEPPAGGDRVQPQVTVVSAEERYLDDPKDVRKLDGVRLKVDLQTLDSPILNIFYETPQGNGSFGESLQRTTRPKTASGAQPRG
ncbi:MAG: hypothetical protein AB7I25_07815 [Vicinamibacterales bacterium]